MSKFHRIFILIFCLSTGTVLAEDLTRWVDPFIGTGKKGNTFPGAVMPWGMVSVSPHTELKAPSGYKHGSPFLYGFGHVHLSGTDCPDLGNILVMPSVGRIFPDPEKWRSAYGNESASPGYYRVQLKDSDILAEMTAILRVGVSRFSFPVRKGDANILIDVSRRLGGEPGANGYDSHVKVVSPDEVEGYSQSGDFCSTYPGTRQTVYFVARFSKAAVSAGTWKDGRTDDSMEQSGRSIGAFLRFSTAAAEPIVVKVGVSYVSIENARLNLDAEAKDWDFEAIHTAAREAWQAELSHIKVTSNADNKTLFYTALYHALLHPNVFSDVNGEFQGMNHSGVHKEFGYTRYSVFQLWNTYRTLHPFLALFYPEREMDMLKSLTEMYKESGWMPRFELAGNETQVMVGDPAVSVIVDGFLQGLKTFDVDSAYEGLVKSLDPDGNQIFGGLKSFLQYGYIPQDDDTHDRIWGSVSTGLEYAYDYWCLAQMARELKKDDDYKKYMRLSGAYRNLFDPTTGFLRAKKRDGSWMSSFDPLSACCDRDWPGSGGPGYVEGNAWQSLFFTPHDMDGLKMLLGGDEIFVGRLQECFAGGHYDAGNEPDLGWPYLFDFVPSEAWRTQKEVRAIMAHSYGMGPDGLPGNDDGGTLSAWYLFSALGFYPVCPGSNLYQLGSPLFQKVEIKTSRAFYPGGLLVIKSIGNSERNVYVRSLLVNGVPYSKTTLSHDTLVNGGTIVFRMDAQPKK